MEEPLSEAMGEPIEIIARVTWPTDRLPRVVDEWMERYKPDVVVLPVSSYWFLYESIPVTQRRFGPAGRFVARIGLKAAKKPWLAHNGVFRAGRRTLQKAIPGSPYFEPEELVETLRATIRRIVRHEGVYVLVIAGSGGDKWASDAAALERFADRRRRVDAGLKDFCRALHVDYWDLGMVASLPKSATPASLQGDKLHLDEEGHRQTAVRQLRTVVRILERAREVARERDPALAR
jgi:hypothetical protein